MGKLNILFIWSDKNHSNVNFRNAEHGNIGVGGTDFLFGTIPHELAKNSNISVSVLHRNKTNVLSMHVNEIVKSSDEELENELLTNSKNYDFIVLRADQDIFSLMRYISNSANVIAWAHNHLRSVILDYLGSESKIKAVVNVGREQMLLTRLSTCYKKSTWIDNPVYEPIYEDGICRKKKAVYLGAIIPTKGFHRLARLWPEIKEFVPDAELDVIGSVNLYGEKSNDNNQYLSKILKYFNGNPERFGVNFLGKLGQEKNAVLQSALVGLPNPTGFTETSCLSALEMSINGLAIVAPRRWGFCDTVSENVSGLLVGDDKSYIATVSGLLTNSSRAVELGESGRQWVKSNFGYKKICGDWISLFESLQLGRLPSKAIPSHPIGQYPHKMLYSLEYLGGVAQPICDLADKIYGWKLRR